MARKNLRTKIVDALDRKLSFLNDAPHLSRAKAIKLLQHNDSDVKALETKHPIMDLRNTWDKVGEPERLLKNAPKYLYEPYTRYKRIENPDYNRQQNYSLGGTVTGVGMLATGLASGLLPLAYAGAALALASFGYQSGQWWRHRKVDFGFEKVPSELEKKAIQEIHDKNPNANQSAYAEARYMANSTPEEDDKGKELYVKRTHRIDALGAHGVRMYGYEDLHHKPRESSNLSWIGNLGIIVATFLGLAAVGEVADGIASEAVQTLSLAYTAGSIGLASLGHYAGYIFSKKTAPAEYQKVGELEKKTAAVYDKFEKTLGKNEKIKKYDLVKDLSDEDKEPPKGLYETIKKLYKSIIGKKYSTKRSEGYPPDYEGPRS